jgi:hypothetical protein
MAKVSGPLMSMDASGAFGGALVFGKWKGRPTVRQLVTPSNPQSANQTTARNRIRATGAAQHQVRLSTQIKSGQTLTEKALLMAAAPSGYAWNGFLTDSMVGAGGLTYTAANAAWTALTAPQKSAWDVAAAARTPAFPATNQATAGGGVGTPLTAGEVYFYQQYGMFAAGVYTTAPGAVPPTFA